MLNLIFRFLRLLSTIFVYTIFVMGSVFLGTIAYFLIIIVTIRSQVKRTALFRKLVSYSIKFFLMLCSVFFVFKVNIKNAQALESAEKVVIIANHPTLVDYLIIMSFLNTSISVLVKESLTHGFMRFIIKNLGYVHNQSTPEILEECFKKNNGLLIFPEGTRTKDYDNIKFVRGAARVAIANDLPILPVYINCSDRNYLAKRFFDFNIPKSVPKIDVEIGHLLKLNKYKEECQTDAIMARHITADLEKLYKDYLQVNK